MTIERERERKDERARKKGGANQSPAFAAGGVGLVSSSKKGK